MIKNKGSQITIFIIVGILLVIVASLIFFLVYDVNGNREPPIDTTIMIEADLIKESFNGCIERIIKDSLILLGQQGGYIFKPQTSLEFDHFFVSYGFYEGQNLLPGKEQIEQDVSKYVKDNLNVCTNNLQTNFDNYDFDFGEINAKTFIKEEEIMVEVNYPIAITYFDTAQRIEEFDVKVPIRLSHVLDIANQTIESKINNPNYIDFALLTDSGMNTTILYHGEDKRIYIFKDPESKINNNDYVFMFAHKLNKNLPPDLFTFDEYEIKVGEELKIIAQAKDFDGDEITYSGMDTIDQKTGLIRFMSTIPETYTFTIRATDTHGNYDEEKLVIEVTKA